MSTIVVLGTGGTIAGRHGPDGAVQPAEAAADLLATLPSLPDGVEVVVRDVLAKDSSSLTPADQVHIVREVGTALADPTVAGVVVTHGTDTTEETAYLLDLVHTDERTVVLTGAQRPADAPDPDGPGNLADAIRVAADPSTRGLGVLVVFAGLVLAARGTRKVHTSDLAGFAPADGRFIGQIDADGLTVLAGPVARPHLGRAALAIEPIRVDIAAVHPGVDDVSLRAFAAAGARGIVLLALGAGNANAAVVGAVAELSSQGIVIGLTTRVDQGPVIPSYGGGGGGADLVAAGAVPLGTLRAGQGRILLQALLAALGDPVQVRAAIPGYAE